MNCVTRDLLASGTRSYGWRSMCSMRNMERSAPSGWPAPAAGVALLIFKAPFPRIIRWPLAFTYFMVYQYAVIARSYTLLPLLAFASAILFKDIRHPERMTVVLVSAGELEFARHDSGWLLRTGVPDQGRPLVAHPGSGSADALPDLRRRDGTDLSVSLRHLETHAGHRCLCQE